MELVRRSDGTFALDAATLLKIAAFERMAKEVKEGYDKLKAAILAEMERQEIIKIETDEVLISYIAPTDRESFDAKQLRKDDPDLYDRYVKMTPVKSSVRIKVKE